MPVPTPEQLAEKEASLKKRIAAEGENADKTKRRMLAKKLRRIQRRRRRAAVQAARHAPKPKADAAAPAEGTETPPAADA